MRKEDAAPAPPSARRPPDWTVAAVAVLALAGAAHVLVRTSAHGAAIGNDSVRYLVEALDFMAGGGALHGIHPPLFPLILAFAGSVSGAEPAECARWILAAAFGATIWVSGAWLRRRLRSQVLAVIVAAGIAASYPLTDIASWVMTDILCALFVMIFLAQMDSFLHRGERRWQLAAAALAAAFAAATRFPGAAAILAGVTVLLLDRERGAAGRLGNAAAFGLLSSAPVAVVVAINLTRGSGAFGQRGDPLHRVVDGPGQLVRVFADWAAAASTSVMAAAIAIAMAAVLATGVTWQLQRLSPTPSGGRRGVFVFAVFAIVYLACITVAAPLLTVGGVQSRYLVPVYAPLTLAAAFAFDRFASRARGRRGPFAQAAIFAVLTAFIAHAGSNAWTSLGATRAAIESGYASSTYNTPYWEDIDLFEYFRKNPDAGPVFSNHPRAFAAAFERIYTRAGRYGGADFTPLLPKGDVGDLEHWIDGAPAGAHIVWFRYGGLRYRWPLSYDGADLRCRRGLKLVAETPDGFVVRVAKGHAPDCRLPSPPEGAATVRARFDLYRDGGFLVYSRTPCSRKDTQANFFLHLYPVDTEDLPLRRRKWGYDNLDFYFGKFGMRVDGGCAARVPLPDYPAARAATGQFDRDGKIWGAEYAFPTAAP